MKPIRISDHKSIVFFTGAGMSAESGVPTYRGSGGIWNQYRWEEVASQEAFDENPEKVLRSCPEISCTFIGYLLFNSNGC